MGSQQAVAALQVLLAESGSVSRSEIARRVCDRFHFVDSLGRWQLAGCQKALRSLVAAGPIQLPPQPGGHWPGRPSRLGRPVPEPVAGSAVQGLQLTPVWTRLQRRTWNEIVAAQHPHGAVLHVGAQLRYPTESRHGILGAVGFAASALAEWTGWLAPMRRKHLHHILGLKRFLIRPSVRCHCLASKMLAKVLRRLPDDFRQRYCNCPARVETFCDVSQHPGPCFRAANCTCIGQTVGMNCRDKAMKNRRHL